jgi:hypothetical protein
MIYGERIIGSQPGALNEWLQAEWGLLLKEK